MDFITKLFDMDLSALVPEMSVFLTGTYILMVAAVLAGPVALTALGALYLFRPVPEANFRFGFRTYFGMGSVEAWRFSQRMAGLIFGALGVLLTVIMVIVAFCFIGKDLLQIAKTAVICLLWQVGLTLIARITISVMAGVYFDKNGNRRK